METSVLPILTPGCTQLSDRKRAADALYATGHLLLEQQKPAHASGVFRAMALLVPTDERAWLGLGACHEAIDQAIIALEMYGTGRMLARSAVRCELARARILKRLGRDDDADQALDHAEQLAATDDDDAMRSLVERERNLR